MRTRSPRETRPFLTPYAFGVEPALYGLPLATPRRSLLSLEDFAFHFGLTFGWVSLYFVLSLVWMDGQTPAKKWLGLRVIKVNGQPITLWNSMERFGGYAAGLATGLLGFAQIYWYPNRQTIHDKIAESVVIDERKPSMAWQTQEAPLS
jgi:uncharacterized RDD family membrane protein YckC